MTSECECLPGSKENGWHERRCADCLLIERAEWQRIVALSTGDIRYRNAQ